jgi:hypothetical protein
MFKVTTEQLEGPPPPPPNREFKSGLFCLGAETKASQQRRQEWQELMAAHDGYWKNYARRNRLYKISACCHCCLLINTNYHCCENDLHSRSNHKFPIPRNRR